MGVYAVSVLDQPAAVVCTDRPRCCGTAGADAAATNAQLAALSIILLRPQHPTVMMALGQRRSIF